MSSFAGLLEFHFRSLINTMLSGDPLPPLKPLHSEMTLNPGKLAAIEKLSSETIKKSLMPGQDNCLKARPDGTMLDGHHRIHVLRCRRKNVDVLPREEVRKSGLD